MHKFVVSILFSLCLANPSYSQAWWELDISGHQGSGDNSNSFFRQDIKQYLHRDPAQRNREAGELRNTTDFQQTRGARKKIGKLLEERIAAITALQETSQGDTTRLITCTKCAGSTFEPCLSCSAKGHIACPMCGGINKRVCRICDGSGILNEQTCAACQGLGKSICKACNGAGAISCNLCEGAAGKNCTLCRGAGKVMSTN